VAATQQQHFEVGVKRALQHAKDRQSTKVKLRAVPKYLFLTLPLAIIRYLCESVCVCVNECV